MLHCLVDSESAVGWAKVGKGGKASATAFLYRGQYGERVPCCNILLIEVV